MSTTSRKRAVFDIDGVTVKLVARTWDSHAKREFRSKTRLYSAPDALTPELMAVEPPYVAYTDEDSTDAEVVAEQVWLAWRRSTLRVAARRVSELLDKLVAADLDGVGIARLDSHKARWSFKAGCSCGCSSGHVLDGQITLDGTPADVFLSIPAEACEGVA